LDGALGGADTLGGVRSKGYLLAAAVALIAVVALETRVARAGGVGPGRYRLLGLILLWWALALGGSWLLLRARPGRAALALLFLGPFALQIGALTTWSAAGSTAPTSGRSTRRWPRPGSPSSICSRAVAANTTSSCTPTWSP